MNQILSIDQVVRGMLACRANARELIAEAKTLQKNGSLARSYVLLFTACEELAKFFVLELGGKRSALGNPPVWKRFWQRFRSHDSKMAQLNLQLLTTLGEQSEGNLVDTLGAIEILTGPGILTRNSALYVDTGPDGDFRKPSDIDFAIPLEILDEATKLALIVADRRGRSGDEIKRFLHQPLSNSETKNFERVSRAVMLRMKLEGVDKERVIKIIEKSKSQ